MIKTETYKHERISNKYNEEYKSKDNVRKKNTRRTTIITNETAGCNVYKFLE